MRISDWSSDVCSSDLEHFRAGADGALDVLARNLRTLRHRGLQAVEVTDLGDLAPDGEGGVGVLFERGQLQAEHLLGVLEGQAVDLGGGVGELSSEERSVGEACVSTGGYRWWRYIKKKKTS